MVIQGGRVIDPASGLDATADVVISDGVVRSILRGRHGATVNGNEVTRLDAEGCIVCPGLIDIHVHFREPSARHQETVASGAASAINGGFATVCCMPNTQPPLDSAMAVEYVASRALRANLARVFVIGCATEGRNGLALAPIQAMADAGAVGFSDDGDVVADAGLMARALQAVKSVDSIFMQHCQEPSMTRGGVMNAGALATRLGLGGWPAAAEEVIIERDIRLNRSIGCRYHVQHASSAGSVELIRAARKHGEPVTGEASPHHLLLTEKECDGYNTQAKVNPPLRMPRDVEALKKGVADGTLTVLGTDHAPHPQHTKETDFASAAFGMVGLDCALPLYIRALVHDGVIDWPRLVALMTSEPAKLVGLHAVGLGRLAVEGPADITIIDPSRSWTIDPSEFASAGRNCPFAGWKVEGRAIATIVGGDIRQMREPARMNGAAVASRG